MADVQITWNNDLGYAEWSLANGDLVWGNDLETAVLASIFTDRVASADFKPINGDPRGHFTDTFNSEPCGSSLWQLYRGKFSAAADIVGLARDYCQIALQWMIDDGIVDTIDVQTARSGSTTLAIEIALTEPRVVKPTVFRYSYAWRELST